MNRATAGVATLAAIGASLLGVLALAGSATAKRPCQVIPKSALVPHLLTPCDGATVAEGGSVTFKVHDGNSKAPRYHPYLNLTSSHKLVHGHLVNDLSGNGLFQELSPVKGHPGQWTTIGKHQIYPSYWDNHPGTYYVQVQQIDTRAPGNALMFYSPIVTIHVR